MLVVEIEIGRHPSGLPSGLSKLRGNRRVMNSIVWCLTIISLWSTMSLLLAAVLPHQQQVWLHSSGTSNVAKTVMKVVSKIVPTMKSTTNATTKLIVGKTTTPVQFHPFVLSPLLRRWTMPSSPVSRAQTVIMNNITAPISWLPLPRWTTFSPTNTTAVTSSITTTTTTTTSLTSTTPTAPMSVWQDMAIWFMKRTFQPSIVRKKRKQGYLARQSTPGGRRVLQRRRLKGRKRIAM